MSHYKPNLRDLEFNLFEWLGRDQVLGQGEYADLDADTAREMLAEVTRLAVEDLAPSLLSSDRTPARLRPEDTLGHAARGVQALLPGVPRRRVVAHRRPGRARRHGRPAVAALGPRRAGARGQPRGAHVRLGPRLREGAVPARHRRDQKQLAAHHGRAALGLHDGAHRAGRRLRRRRRAHQGGAAARRHLAHHRRQAVHHLGRGRHLRQRRAPRAGPPRGARPGHQGPVAVRRPEVPRRPGDRRARASATASSSPTSSTRWASRSPPPASCGSARSTASPRSARCSATCTTASRRCSTSSSPPG